MFRVITYDIKDDRTRTRLAKTLEGFGYRVQYSVFEAILTPSQYRDMKQSVSALIDPKEDSVIYYNLCRSCRRHIEIIPSRQATSKPRTIIV